MFAPNIVLFSNISPEDQEKFADKATFYPFSKGDRLFYTGQAVDKLRIVHEGKVKLHQFDLEGKEQIYDIVDDGESIGEDLFMEEEPKYPYDGLCLTDGWICEISRKDFQDLLRQEPGVAMNLIESLSRKLARANERMEILAENDAGIRLANFFYHRCKRQEKPIIDLTVDDIAGSINLRRETVSRKIKELRSAGIVQRLGQSRIQVTDFQRLRQFIGGESYMACV